MILWMNIGNVQFNSNICIQIGWWYDKSVICNWRHVSSPPSVVKLNFLLSFVKLWVLHRYISGGSWPPTPTDILEPSHGRVFRGKLHSGYVVKGIRSLLTDLSFNKLNLFFGVATLYHPKQLEHIINVDEEAHSKVIYSTWYSFL